MWSQAVTEVSYMLYVSYTPLSYELLLKIHFEVIQMSNDNTAPQS